MIKLSVVICTGDREESLKKVLKSLEKQSFKQFEVIEVREKPLAKARDLGFRRAKGEIVAFIDDDVVLSKDWAVNVVRIMSKDKSIGGVSGPTIVPEKLLKNRLVFWWYGKDDWLSKLWVKLVLEDRPFEVGRIYSNGWWSPGSNFKSCLKLEGLWEVDYLEACNMSFRRELVKRAGGFDKGFLGTAEWCEPDLGMKIKRLGYRLVWSRKVKVIHEVSRKGVFKERRRLVERVKNYCRFRDRWIGGNSGLRFIKEKR